MKKRAKKAKYDEDCDEDSDEDDAEEEDDEDDPREGYSVGSYEKTGQNERAVWCFCCGRKILTETLRIGLWLPFL